MFKRITLIKATFILVSTFVFMHVDILRSKEQSSRLDEVAKEKEIHIVKQLS